MKITSRIPTFWRNRFAEVPVLVFSLDIEETRSNLGAVINPHTREVLLRWLPELNKLQSGPLSASTIGEQLRNGDRIAPIELSAAIAYLLQKRVMETPHRFGSQRGDPLYGDLIFVASQKMDCRPPCQASRLARIAPNRRAALHERPIRKIS